MKIAALLSTNGSVLRSTLEYSSEKVDLIITDRECKANKISLEKNIPSIRIEASNSPEKLSKELLLILIENKIDYLLLFYTKLLSMKVLTKYRKRIINFHPSILPSFPGLNGFNESIESESLFIGSTVHFIDDGIDTGPHILQCKTHNYGQPKREIRHIIFSQQVASLAQTLKSIRRDEFAPHSKKKFKKLDYSDDNSFSCPKLDRESLELYWRILNEKKIQRNH